MRSIMGLSLALGLALFGARNAGAIDYWDLASDSDDSIGTDNELLHGASQQHDLQTDAGVPDQDWHVVINYPASSYEALIDATSGDLDMFLSSNFERLDSSGTTVLQSAEYANVGANTGYSVALRWEHIPGGTPERQYLRVRSSICGTTCGPEDQYRIRFYETTVSVPRFNNAAGQVTVLIIQNTTRWTRNITGSIYFWDTVGNFLGNAGFNVFPRGAFVLNTSTVPGVAGQGGTISVAHDGGYGNLAIKSVALEPATGFSFDTPGTYKPQ